MAEEGRPAEQRGVQKQARLGQQGRALPVQVEPALPGLVLVQRVRQGQPLVRRAQARVQALGPEPLQRVLPGRLGPQHSSRPL